MVAPERRVERLRPLSDSLTRELTPSFRVPGAPASPPTVHRRLELLNVNAKTMNIVLDVSARLTRYTADTATFDGRLGMPQSLQP